MSKFEMYRGVGLAGLFLGLLIGGVVGFAADFFTSDDAKSVETAAIVEPVDASVYVNGIISNDPGRIVVALSDGRVSVVEASRFDASGKAYKVGGVWFREKR